MFVEHGGSSLDALRVASQIKAWFHQETGQGEDELYELVDVILNCSFGKLCDYIKTRIPGQSSSEATVSQGDLPLTSAIEDSSKVITLSERETTLKLSKNDNDEGDKEVTTPVSSKKRKIEDAKPPAQTEVTTGLPRCFCSIQRGMRATTCRSCRTPSTPSSVVHTQGPLKGSISQKWKADFHKCIDASPLVVGTSDKDMAVVYLGSHSHVFKAVCLSNGKVLWETRLGDRIESSAGITKCGQYVVVGEYCQ